MAHSLVPKFYSEFWLQRAAGTIPRIAPNEDHEVSLNRDKCFKKLFPNPDDLRRVYVEYGMFSGGLGFFSEPHVMEARVHEVPLIWWARYGSCTPMLQALANKLLSQPASSSCCERNSSDFSQIQSVKRNKLDSKRTEDLVYVHNNLRLFTHKTDEYKRGPSSYWDVGGDSLSVDADMNAFANIIAEDPTIEEMLRNYEDGDYGEDENAVLE
ncbi:uncharacterized protein LOC141634184 [Silene latifolia]|uniref:uncharacterized protein LOC141634184 n=1 Tax=Silene latifolia TaxID=37657 RepID=UPI003D77FFE0